MIFHRIYNWFIEQNVLPKLFKAVVLFGMFGFIPGAWMIGVPLMFLYGLYKKELVAAALVRFIQRASHLWEDMSAELGAFISNQFVNNPLGILKLLASIFLFATMSMPFSFLGIYGLYRYTPAEWKESFGRFSNRVLRFFTVGVADTIARMSVRKRFILGSLLTASLALLAYSGGGLLFLDLGFMAAQSALIYTGFSAFFGDAKTWLSRPVSNISTNVGKMLGILWGRWLAYEIFTGTISGSLGPALGQVRTQGVVSAVIPSFLSPRNGWFALNSGYFNILMARISTFFNSVISGLFFSHNMRLWGDFQGYIGPNSFQIFTLMIIGGLVGYGAERLVNALYESLRNDSLSAIKAAEPTVVKSRNQLYQARWHVALTVIATPVILASPGAGQIVALAGGSLLGATALTASAVGLALAGVYGAGYAVKSLYRKFWPAPAVVPAAAPVVPLPLAAVVAPGVGVVPAVAPAPVALPPDLADSIVLPTPAASFMPAFEGERDAAVLVPVAAPSLAPILPDAEREAPSL